MTPGMRECVEFIAEEGGEAIIVSDSNTVFIRHLLDKWGLADRFRRVFTNPAYFGQDGMLNVKYFHQVP